MQNLLTIELKELRFFARHGLYQEEKKTGNEFEVNLKVFQEPVSGVITDLAETVNYVRLYELLNTEMQKPRELLETFVMEMADSIHHIFPQVKQVEICISKLQPPIVRFKGAVSVRFSKTYK